MSGIKSCDPAPAGEGQSDAPSAVVCIDKKKYVMHGFNLKERLAISYQPQCAPILLLVGPGRSIE
jgi:hypothetical protein